MKRCPDCDEWKPLDEFPRNRRTKDGRHAYCKPCHNARGKESIARLYGDSRHYHLRRRYGIGALDVQRLIEQQDGRCPICDKPDPEHVDHDHATRAVRGILCFNCNGGLGQFRDNPAALRSAAEYVEAASPEAQQVIEAARDRALALRDSES